MKQTLLVYTGTPGKRLTYVLDWLCKEQLGLDYRCTLDSKEWEQWPGPKIVYHRQFQPESALRILPSGLLDESTIHPLPLAVQRWKHSTVLFYNQPGATLPFDLFSAIFYLLSRYEEYLPFTPDAHGRFPVAASAAGQYRFLQQPVVDEWVHQLQKLLEEKFSIVLSGPGFRYQVSFDVDMAWRYLHQSPQRQALSKLKDLLLARREQWQTRKAVLSGKQQDPYDCFDSLLAADYPEAPLFFFLLAKPGKFDRNTDAQHPAMKQLVQDISAKYITGLHPSYAAHSRPGRLQQERDLLRKYTGKEVVHSRQHYLKFRLPDTYRQLIAAGIKEEYSMGYATQNGFRAGTSRSFLWFDLLQNEVSGLRVHPFVFMDATAWFYQQYNLTEAFSEWERLYLAVGKNGGTFISIWHNHLLGWDKSGRKQQALLEQTLNYVQSPA